MKTPKDVPVQAPKKAVLPHSPRSSLVTLTLGEGVNTSYAEVLASARGKILQAGVGIEGVKMRKAMTGTIILEVPGD